MDAEEFKKRTRRYALRVVRLASSLDAGGVGQVFARELVAAVTGVATNYRIACLAQTAQEFVSQLAIVEEQADRVVFWIELAADAELVDRPLIAELIEEGTEILAIVTASRKASKTKRGGG
jgi:four helix bundle protein